MWMVRADTGGRLFEDFKKHSFVGIGWHDMGNMGGLKAREDFSQAVAKAWPENKPMQVASAAGQAYRFVREIKIGDRILTYDPSERMYLLGTVDDDYRYEPDRPGGFANVRRVKWEEEIARDRLSVATRNSLGAISTLFLVPSEAAAEIEGLARKDGPSFSSDIQEEDAIQVDAILKDIQSKAFEFIKDKISALDWEEMQELVAALLRAMGYKTRVSPSGADRGKDIVASPDGFGFESPRIVVEVKHRSGSSMGSQEIRSFLGGRHKDDKGLYVSTGGFSKDARYEAERASIPLTLMDLDDLVKAILDHYEEMDADSQRLIPLRKVYWPS
jgi:restriction system protein